VCQPPTGTNWSVKTTLPRRHCVIRRRCKEHFRSCVLRLVGTSGIFPVADIL
jgi:hypothetical protein